jgi:aryl-alcohol dehydrogenase-like predicted oxidoreductase
MFSSPRLGSSSPSSRSRISGEFEQEARSTSSNPTLQRFNTRNWAIVGEFEAIAKAMNRSMAEVAINWVANRPGVASVIVGATKLKQLEENIGSLSFEMPAPLRVRLDTVSAPERSFPYVFFDEELQGMVHGGASVGATPSGYLPTVQVSGAGAGVSA